MSCANYLNVPRKIINTLLLRAKRTERNRVCPKERHVGRDLSEIIIFRPSVETPVRHRALFH